ncbi:MAG: hypothetical protein JO208_15100 [Alphaproteobacteria bacterium]|nr:hypothetical protein [Alphaproteobacteria bacterium]
MLISLSRKFIFVANLKSASSSIERALGSYAEFKVTQTQYGKHDELTAISKKFHWIKKYVPLEEFYIFGVIRDPIDFILSLYNFHTREGFDGKRHSSKGLSFDQFWEVWCGKSWQTRPQHRRFVDRTGKFQMNHIVRFAELNQQFPALCSRIGVTAQLGHANISPDVLSRGDLTEEQISRIKVRYTDDYKFIDNLPRDI